MDRDVDTGWQIELFKLVHGAGGGIKDVEEAFVRANLELLGRFFVLVNGTVDREFFDFGRDRHGTGYFGTGALGGFHDFFGRAVDGAGVEST